MKFHSKTRLGLRLSGGAQAYGARMRPLRRPARNDFIHLSAFWTLFATTKTFCRNSLNKEQNQIKRKNKIKVGSGAVVSAESSYLGSLHDFLVITQHLGQTAMSSRRPK